MQNNINFNNSLIQKIDNIEKIFNFSQNNFSGSVDYLHECKFLLVLSRFV